MAEKVMFNKVRLFGNEVELREYTIPFNVSKREKKKSLFKVSLYKRPRIHSDSRFDSSLSRTRSSVYDICKCNCGSYPKFLTLTCRESILDYDTFLYEMKQFFKKMKRKGYDLRYLWVAEHQTERGIKEGNEGSYHSHIIIFNDDYIPYQDINECWDGRTEIKILNSVRYNNNIATDEKILNVCSYVVKYITKEMVNEFGRNLYHCSRGLFRPLTVREEYQPIYDTKGQLCHYKLIENQDYKSFKYLKDNMIITNEPQGFCNTFNGYNVCCQVTRGYLPNG